MSEASQDVKNAWVSSVLGIKPAGYATVSSAASAGSGSDPTAPAVGIVAYRKALLGFRSAIAQVNGQLSSFADRLADALPAEAELAGRVAEEVNAECERLNDRIDGGIGAPTAGRAAENKKIQRAVIGLIAQVRANKLIAHIDDNPLMPMSVGATLTGALARVAETIV